VPGSGSILLVDDDVGLCRLMADFFADSGFALEAVHDGTRGLARALEGPFDLILLDVMLPLLDGFTVLRQLRRRSPVPVIMLTARTEQRDRVEGLDAGADDYLPKPFDPEELLARIRAVLRRSGHALTARTEVIGAGSLRLNLSSREARAGARLIPLTCMEFDILELLVRSAGRVVSRDEVCTVLYQRPATPFERSLEVHISHVRRKTEGTGIAIRSIRSAGYLLAEETPAG
jgi:two-component system, OmpR family, response regulator CpxR